MSTVTICYSIIAIREIVHSKHWKEHCGCDIFLLIDITWYTWYECKYGVLKTCQGICMDISPCCNDSDFYTFDVRDLKIILFV